MLTKNAEMEKHVSFDFVAHEEAESAGCIEPLDAARHRGEFRRRSFFLPDEDRRDFATGDLNRRTYHLPSLP
jgi:hypothetical protein